MSAPFVVQVRNAVNALNQTDAQRIDAARTLVEDFTTASTLGDCEPHDVPTGGFLLSPDAPGKQPVVDVRPMHTDHPLNINAGDTIWHAATLAADTQDEEEDGVEDEPLAPLAPSRDFSGGDAASILQGFAAATGAPATDDDAFSVDLPMSGTDSPSESSEDEEENRPLSARVGLPKRKEFPVASPSGKRPKQKLTAADKRALQSEKAEQKKLSKAKARIDGQRDGPAAGRLDRGEAEHTRRCNAVLAKLHRAQSQINVPNDTLTAIEALVAVNNWNMRLRPLMRPC
jgi:hypothetical protein